MTLHRLAVWTLFVPLAIGSPTLVTAGGLSFTWNPSASSPPLGGSSFSANSITLENYLRGVNQSGQTTLHHIQPIKSFQNDGVEVSLAGLGSLYGLYFDIQGLTASNLIGPPTYLNLDVKLVADVNADNGTVSSTIAGIGFSNPGGVANDLLLATGSLIAASLQRDPVTDIRRGRYLDTFSLVPAQAGFFVTPPGVAAKLEINLTTLPDRFASLAQPNGSTIQLVNSGVGTAQLVPEPTSLMLLGIATLGLCLTRRKYRA